jgi:hypothetical protein
MKIKNIIKDCTLGITAYLTLKNDSIKTFLSYIIYNKEIIEQFSNLIIVVNTDKDDDVEIIKSLLNQYIDDCDIIFLEENRGHTFGTMDLEEELFIQSKNYPQKYLFKTSQDVVFQPQFLDTLIVEADFYYIPGFSYETIVKTNNNFLTLKNSDKLTPQTNFFILNKNKASNIYGGNDYITEYYNKFIKILKTNPQAKPWEEFPDPKFDCETLLKRNVISNNLTECNILNDLQFQKLFNLVKDYKIGDPSHKNIMLPCGLSHYHYPTHPVIDLN